MRAVAKCSVTAERGRCCTVQVKAGVVALKATVGKNTAGFGKRLKPGSYTATVVASGAGGTSKAVIARFRVRR
jgi:hypothetical protein